MENKSATILLVDDEPNNLKLLQQILKNDYDLKFANNGEKALIGVKKHKPDLILLDVMMPEMDGYLVCKKLKESIETAKIPVIFVTAKGEVGDTKKGFDLGAVDYITKPIEAPILLARISTHLKLMNKDIATLEGLMSLMRAAKLKDNETANHTLRVAIIAFLIATHLEFEPTEAYHLFLVAPLHDIGKIGVRDEILFSQENLRNHPGMWAKMQAHTTHGADIIGSGIESPIMQMAYNVARFHHEKLDGSGYPDKLKGDEIPIEAMIVSVADMIDAMLDPTRPYRKGPVNEKQIRKILLTKRKVKLPANIIDAALLLWDQILVLELAFPSDSPVLFNNFSNLSAKKLSEKIDEIIFTRGGIKDLKDLT